MTRLERVLDLLESYDRLSATALENCHGFKQELFTELLDDLRDKKEQLAKELIEHGCRRK
jgi:flagellar biosynthesis regulator FlaF